MAGESGLKEDEATQAICSQKVITTSQEEEWMGNMTKLARYCSVI